MPPQAPPLAGDAEPKVFAHALGIGGTVEEGGLAFSMVPAFHSAGIVRDGEPRSMGDPAGNGQTKLDLAPLMEAVNETMQGLRGNEFGPRNP